MSSPVIKAPLWVRVVFHVIDLSTFLALPPLVALDAYAAGEMPGRAALRLAAVAVLSAARLWLKSSPLWADLGLRPTEDAPVPVPLPRRPSLVTPVPPDDEAST